MTDTTVITGQLGEVERQISDGEALLRRSGVERVWAWIFFSAGLLAILFSENPLFAIIGVVVVAASIWRMHAAEKYAREIEDGLREYRGRRAELWARLLFKG